MTGKRALVASYRPPQFDRDSGSRRTFDLLELMLEDGWELTFVAASGVPEPRYARALEQRGIPVVDGRQHPIDDLVLAGSFDLALLSFWPVAEFYLPLLRRLSPATRVVVDSLDLQFLRDGRRILRWDDGPVVLDDEFGRQLTAEVNTYAAADGVLTVSAKEAHLLAELTGRPSLADVIPDIEDGGGSAPGIDGRAGMIFVGSFRHAPNVDAVEYLCREIVPRLNPALLAEHHVYVVGDGIDDGVRAFAEGLPQVHMVGWVPELAPYLQRARISLVPLRFGAGTKRKTIQTLMAGTPCVSTSIGAEGLDLASGTHLLIADDPEDFAESVELLMTDDDLWPRFARNARERLESTHSRAAVRTRFSAVLADVARRPPSPLRPPDTDRNTYKSRLAYQDRQRALVRQREVRALLDGHLPEDATVLVVAGGSDELLRLGSCTTWHFPQRSDGRPAPNPATDLDAIAAVEDLVEAGATHLLFPLLSLWWLDHYPDFAAYLFEQHSLTIEQDGLALLFTLSAREAPAVTVVSPTTPAPVENARAKLIAFYLPQFHPIPENDAWWGEGFTEWLNVSKATPLFPDHLQPRIPADLGYYDLRLGETREEQAELARQYGIDAFCYYHYWFGGKRLLERPFDEVFRSGRPDFPFCLCWANEPWSRRWDGTPNDVLQHQSYSADDDIAHIRALLPVLGDDRCLRVADKPLVIIYQARDLPDPAATVDRWRTEADRAGLPGLYLVTVETGWDAGWDATPFGFDAKVLFQPQFSLLSTTPRLPIDEFDGLRVHDYQRAWPILADPPPVSYLRYDTVFPRWDNSPRRGSEGVVVHNSTPEAYEQWLRTAIDRATSRPPEERLVFLNAWNEWAEGCYLEPDLAHGRAYLEATRRALEAPAAVEGLR